MLSTLASTLFRDCHFCLLPQTLGFLRFSCGDDGARTRDLCRDRAALWPTELRPQIVFQHLRFMSHRIKRFAAFAIFALFYHFAAVDSILSFGGHHVDTKVDTKTATA